MFLFFAAAVTLVWDSVAGAVSYRLHVGIQSMRAGNPPIASYLVDVPKFEVTGLDYATTYYFVATAIDAQGLESAYSNEVIWTPAPPPEPTPVPTETPTPSPGKRKGHSK
jgi:hypothetical protein